MKFTNFRSAIGKKITHGRKLKKITQEELAYMIGSSRTSVTNMEKGRNSLPLNKVAQMCLLLDMKLDDFMDWDAAKKEMESRVKRFSAFDLNSKDKK